MASSIPLDERPAVGCASSKPVEIERFRQSCAVLLLDLADHRFEQVRGRGQLLVEGGFRRQLLEDTGRIEVLLLVGKLRDLRESLLKQRCHTQKYIAVTPALASAPCAI